MASMARVCVPISLSLSRVRTFVVVNISPVNVVSTGVVYDLMRRHDATTPRRHDTTTPRRNEHPETDGWIIIAKGTCFAIKLLDWYLLIRFIRSVLMKYSQ